MGIEIERKFLVINNDWRDIAKPLACRQGYIYAGKKGAVRVRTINEKGYLTVKSAMIGLTRLEFEYEIPLNDANNLLENMCANYIIEKQRSRITYGNHVWEIDEFHGYNKGLILAEIELNDENEIFERPSWIGKEVSSDTRYHNSNLSKKPFCQW